MAAQSRSIEAPVFGDLQTVLDATWTNHVVMPPSRVTVEASSSGMFDCSPTLWYFFAGQYRTFDSVAPAIAQSAAQFICEQAERHQAGRLCRRQHGA